VPSKALIACAKVAHQVRQASAFGVRTERVEIDFSSVMNRVRRVRAEMAHHDGADGMRKRGVDVLFGTARFTSHNTVDLDGTSIRFRRAVIATGGRPAIPDVPGLRENCLTSESIFELTEKPHRLLVIGGGPIGCELAQAFGRLGVAVTLVQRGPRLLPKDDPDAADIIQGVFHEEGIDVRLQTEPTKVDRVGNELHVTMRSGDAEYSLIVDRILIAAGRVPNLESLDLAVAGVEYDSLGVKVNARHRTSNARIYAAGDVCSPFQFTHVAYAQAEYACLNAMLPVRMNARDRVMSWTTYTDPEVAHVGVPWPTLQETIHRYESFTVPMTKNDRAQTDGDTHGFVRVHTRRGRDRIVAATIMSAHAGEIAATYSVAITNGLRLRDIQRSIFAYPTRAEAIRKVADEWRFQTFTGWSRQIVGSWIRIRRLWT
jgi:pyruvate/2-oxoglutarate dehydrogenase complex dihydrolipoamide dehydrogenase (E3) component